MTEQHKFNPGQPAGLGNTGKECSNVDASETESNKTSAATPHAGSNAVAASTTGAATGSHAGESASQKMERQKQETAEKGREFQEHARQTKESVKHKAKEMADETRHTARDMSDRAMHSAADAAERAQRQAASFAEGQKHRVASEFTTFGEAMSRAAETLREDHDERVAGYAEMAADQLRSTANYLESHQLGDLAGDLEHFARRRPEVFFGGMLLAGLGIARFLKASRKTSGRRELQEQRGMQSSTGMRTAPANDPYAETDDELATSGAWTQPRHQPLNDPLSYH